MSGINQLREAYEYKPDTVVSAIENSSKVSFGRFGRRKVTISFGENNDVTVTIRQLRKLVNEKVKENKSEGESESVKKLSKAVEGLEEALSTKDRSKLPVITRQAVKLKDKISKLASKIKPHREEPVEAPKLVEQEKAENTVGLALRLLSPHFKELRPFGIKANDITALIIEAGTAHGGANEAARIDQTIKLLNVDDQAQVAGILEQAIKAIKDQPELSRLSMFLGILKKQLSEE
jgi:hypothetical protein